MRAAVPVRQGHVERDDAQVHFEVFGSGWPTVFLLMPDVIVDSRLWKAQVPFLARRHRVVTIDPRGNGGSSTPPTPEGFALEAFIDDAWAVLDRIGCEHAVLVGLCSGAGQALVMAAEKPERVLGVCAINPGLPLSPPHPHKVAHDFDALLPTDEGWAKLNRHSWEADWPGFAEFFFDQMLPEPHSTKQWEDCVEYALGTTAAAMLREADAPSRRTAKDYEELCRRVSSPVLVITGTEDQCQPPARGARAAELTGGQLVELVGSGHLPPARDPVKVNLLLDEFLTQIRLTASGGLSSPCSGTS
jgi:pimeloyl-ACP methyl ester carboxylesterase